MDRLAGEVYTSPAAGPHEGVDFTGQRVAVIGTGSSGIQSIPADRRAGQPAHRFPAHPELLHPGTQRPRFPERPTGWSSCTRGPRRVPRRRRPGGRSGRPYLATEPTCILGVTASEAEVRRERFEAAWEQGELFGILGVFADQGFNQASNEIVAEMVREKIRSVVDRSRSPPRRSAPKATITTRSAPSGPASTPTTSRRSTGLTCGWSTCASEPSSTSITETGIDTAERVIRLRRHRVRNRLRRHDRCSGGGGRPRPAKACRSRRSGRAGPPPTWVSMTAGFPNFFMITGPRSSPSVLSNMRLVSPSRQHANWVADCLEGHAR